MPERALEREAPPLEEFHRLTRDLYIPVGDVGFWQGVFRDPGSDDFRAAADAIEGRAAGHRRRPLRRPRGRPAGDHPVRDDATPGRRGLDGLRPPGTGTSTATIPADGPEYTAGMSASAARPGNVTRTRLVAVELGDGRRRTDDALATEEPLEIRLDAPGMEQRAVAVTMRTPGSDFELAAGFLHTEGLIAATGDVAGVRYCDVPRAEQQYNVVTVALNRPYDAALLQRNFYTTSSCGVCGKASLDSDLGALRSGRRGARARRGGRGRAPGSPARGAARVRPHRRPARRRPLRHGRDRCSSYARTSAATTPSTSSSAMPCSRAICRCPSGR